MGSTYPGNIWYKFMSQIHKDLEPRDFLDQAVIDEENVGEDTLQEQQNIVNEKKKERGIAITEPEEEVEEEEEYFEEDPEMLDDDGEN